MKFTPLLVLLVGCTVGLVDETKPIEAYDTAVTDTASDTDTEDTEDSGPDIDENSENPFNGECGDNIDNDGDGRVDCNDSDCVAAPECNQSADGDTDGDGYRDELDCDPYNPYVNPGATEVPNNGIDDDCDGVTDSGTSSGGGNGGNGGTGGNPQTGTVCSDTCTDGFGNLLYGANDGNCQDGGFGDLLALGLGYSACTFGTDCSDCGVRTDADGDFHEDDPLGLGLALYSDCNDSDPTINSSATDIPDDGIDQDCDGADATSASTTPTSETSCTNGVDDDQDGLTDCDDSDCASDAACQSSGGTGGCAGTEVIDCNGNCAPGYWVGDGACDDGSYAYLGNQIDLDCAQHNYDDGDCAVSTPTSETSCTNGVDDDQDGLTDCADSDCAFDSACQPETNCTNGVDDDQDGLTDCDDSDCASDAACQTSSSCSSTQIEDCNGICVPATWLGDGVCDYSPNGTGTYGSYSLMCSALNWDNNDCPTSSACNFAEVEDCYGNCTPDFWLGDGQCDPEFDCETWLGDNLDCP